MNTIKARMLAIVLVLILSASCAQSIGISVTGGGSGGSSDVSVSLSADSSAGVKGEFTVSTETGTITPETVVDGGSSDFIQRHSATDSNGKSAEVFAKILRASSFSYRDWIYPGATVTDEQFVAAGQWATVSNARYIEFSAKATSLEDKTAEVSTIIRSDAVNKKASIDDYVGESVAWNDLAIASQSISNAKSTLGTTVTSTATNGDSIFAITANSKDYSGKAEAKSSDSETYATQTDIDMSGLANGNAPSVENHRTTILTGEQSVILLADLSGIINNAGKTVKSSSDTAIIQSMIDLATTTTSERGDHVIIGEGTYKENIAINKYLTVTGSGTGATIIDGDAKGSVFTVSPNVYAAIEGMTIQNGAFTSGAGIYNAGNLEVTDCEITGNAVTGASTSATASAGKGGGIFNAAAGTLTLRRDYITSNTANWGAGLANLGTTYIYGGTISGNTANTVGSYAGLGGGIFNAKSLTIDKDSDTSTLASISSNSAYYGGGIYNYANSVTGTATIANAKIDYNTATYMGGGIDNVGGAIMTIADSEIKGNIAGKADLSVSSYGGGITNYGQLTISNSQITGNTAKYGGGIFSYGNTVSGKKTITRVTGGSTLSGNTAKYGLDFCNRFVGAMTFDPAGSIYSTTVYNC